MRRASGAPRGEDSDARAIRRASRAVGLQLTIASSALVITVLIATFAFVFAHVRAGRLFSSTGSLETTIDVGGLQVLIAGIVIGAIAIILAGTMSWFATRRAVRPLVDALRIQRNFVADASHELRTPLAVLDARLQLLQRGLGDTDPSSSAVAQLRTDTKTLIGIVNDLLALAEVDGSPVGGEPTPVVPIVQRAVDSMTVLSAGHSVTIRLSPAESTSSKIPEASIYRSLVALLDNALDFSPPGSTIEVSVVEVKSTVVIRVKDHGHGIRGIEPRRIFDRFAHSGEAVGGGGTTRTGFGIGLSLVRDTVERFGGTVRVVETSSAGTTIELRIPSAHPD